MDLLFPFQPNLVIELGVHSSLYQNCHHQIYSKINLTVCYPPLYELEIWHYQRANVDQIQRATEQLSWENSFRNLNINEMYLYLIKLLRTFFQIIFLTKQSLMMTKNHLGLAKISSS